MTSSSARFCGQIEAACQIMVAALDSSYLLFNLVSPVGSVFQLVLSGPRGARLAALTEAAGWRWQMCAQLSIQVFGATHKHSIVCM